MAALSTLTEVTTTWTEVMADGSEYVIANTGGIDVILFFKATAPSASSTDGYVINPTAGIQSSTFGQGKIYARTVEGVSKVVSQTF